MAGLRLLKLRLQNQTRIRVLGTLIARIDTLTGLGSGRYDAASQILAFDLYHMRDTECIRTKKVSMRCFYPEELMALCSFNGLKVCDRYGNYDKSPFTSDSPKQILLCQAVNSA